jgi:hypothetical protein
MVIVEESTNYPTVLGPKNVPRRMQWGVGRIIDNLPSVIAAGMDRSFLPQILPPRGTGLITGTAGPRMGGLMRGPLERLARHYSLLRIQKNIPQPWGPREWSPGALIQTIPSVIQTGGGVAGPSRTMHPSRDLSVEI